MSIEVGFFDKMFSRGRLALLGKPTGGVVHYGGEDEALTLEKVQEWHEKAKSGIGTGTGYHVLVGNGVVTEDGEVLWGRPLKYRGAHCRGGNRRTIGVCLIGDFMRHPPTDAQLKTLVRLLSDWSFVYKWDPYGTRKNAVGKRGPVISGHRDWGSTLCPGDYLYDALPYVRARVGGRLRRLEMAVDIVRIL